MALRSDSVYKVDLSHDRHTAQSSSTATSPPKIIQIRLTEQTLHELVSARSRDGHDAAAAAVSIDVGPSDPVLKIGDTSFPLQAPLAASGPSSTSTDLFRLSEDESTLVRLGAISTKFSVRPTKDISAAATRLKYQREEEELRKEERKRAVMLGSSAVSAKNNKRSSSVSTSSRHGSTTSANNKNLSAVKALGSAGASPLSRSASLNKLSTRERPKENGLISRDQSPAWQGAATSRSSHLPQGSFSKQSSSSRGVLSKANSPSEDMLSDSDQSQEHGYRSNDSSKPKASPSTKNPNGSIVGANLTTRQRLAKAAKKGSRLTAEPELRKNGTAEITVSRSAAVKLQDNNASMSTPPAKERLGHRRTASAITVKDLERQSASRSSALARADYPIDESTERKPLKAAMIGSSPPQSPERRLARIDGELSFRSKPGGNSSASVQTATRMRSPGESTAPDRKRKRSTEPIDDRSGKQSIAQAKEAQVAGGSNTQIVDVLEPTPIQQSPNTIKRKVKGVGPGTAHWQEPWLNVRSTADWHRLAERFAKARRDYDASRHQLEEEKERIEAELQLATTEDQSERRRPNLAQNARGARSDADFGSGPASPPGSAHALRARHKSSDDGSIEEGEMRSSEEVDEKITLRTQHQPPFASADDDEVENETFTWRQFANRNDAPSAPIPYEQLSQMMNKLQDLHDSMNRMHHVLESFKS